MRIKLKVDPMKTTARGKYDLLSKIQSRAMCRSFGKHYDNALMPFSGNDNFVRAYSIEKRRKVVVRSAPNKKDKKTSTVVSPAHWVGHYYDIPVNVLKYANLKVVQHERYFELIPA